MTQQPSWPRRVLQAAAIYNLLWGTWVILFPNHWFDLTGIPHPNYPGIWQCVGMIVGVYGLGYWWASRDFVRHWPVIAVGFLGKIFGPIGFLQSVLTGALPWSWGWMILTNDLIWWVPFAAMLYLAFKYHSDPRRNDRGEQGNTDWDLAQANELARTSTGESIAQWSAKQDVLLVFLRHAGCTFCRETLDELRKSRQQWSNRGLQPIVVHMGSVDQGIDMMKKYGLQDCPVISDPDCRLFRAYQLPRGTWSQLFGLRIWLEGFKAAILKGYGFGKLVGDGFQMSGAFVIRKGQILQAYPSKDAADSCSWKPALTTVLLIVFGILINGSQSAIAQAQTPESLSNESNPGGLILQEKYTISDVHDGDRVEFASSQCKVDCLVLSVNSQKGIGALKLTRKAESWPAKLQIQMHTKGLEQIQLQLGDKSTTYSGEFSTSRLQESWVEIRQDANIDGSVKQTTKPLACKNPWIRLIDTTGKELPKPRLPLQGAEYFEWTIPGEWLKDLNPQWIEIKWVDFFRN